MTASKMPVLAMTLLMAGLGTPMAWTQLYVGTVHFEAKERARVALSHALAETGW